MLRPDLAIYNRQGELTAQIEVKRKVGTSAQWAARLLRNLLAHGDLALAEFFLLATPDRFYVWKRPIAGDGQAIEPTYEIDPQSTLQPYLARLATPPDELGREAFEWIVREWLHDVVSSEYRPDPSDKTNRWLIDSGFLEAVKAGRLEYEAAA